ncbi:MAG: hypothetical protein ACP5N1_03805 [Candidatus Woesearchaeota archaeon]
MAVKITKMEIFGLLSKNNPGLNLHDKDLYTVRLEMLGSSRLAYMDKDTVMEFYVELLDKEIVFFWTQDETQEPICKKDGKNWFTILKG